MAMIPSFNLKKNELINGCYLVGDCLGRGWEGEVYRVTEIYSGGERVLKLFVPADYRLKKIQQYCSKFNKVMSVKGVIHYYHGGYWRKKKTYYMVMELFKGQDLEKHIENQVFTIPESLEIIRKLFWILSDCHNNETCLGDIHLGNILMNDERTIRIIDFDYAVKFTQEQIVNDIVSTCKLFYELSGNVKDYSPALRNVIPKREDAIINRYGEVTQVLTKLDELMGE